MRRPIALLTLSVFLLAVPAASADLPKAKSAKIKVGSSIGGIKLGQAAKSALSAWGQSRSDDCAAITDPAALATLTQTCHWRGKSTEGFASLDIRDGKVQDITLHAGQKSNGECVYKGALPKWKDAKGLGLGSSVPTVAKKYRKGFANGSGWQLNSGKKATLWESSGGRSCTISLTLLSLLG